jgi:hypothetical protein
MGPALARGNLERHAPDAAGGQDGFLSIAFGAAAGLAAGVWFGFEVGNPGPGIALASRLGLVVPLLALVGGRRRLSVPSRLLIAAVGSLLCVLALSPVLERALRTLG